MAKLKFKILNLVVLAFLVVPLISGAGISVNKVNFEKLYVTGGNSGVLVSSDEGSSWSEIGPNLPVNDLVVENDNLFAGTNNGIYRKLSGGNWSLISPNNWSTNLISKNNTYLLAAVGSTLQWTNNPEAPTVLWNLATINLPENHSITKFRQLETVGNYAYAIAEGTKCIPRSDNSFICLLFNFYLGSNDGGKNWSFLNKHDLKWRFHSCLAIDANNPNVYAHGGYDGLKIMNWDQQIADENRWAVADCKFIGQNLVISSFDAFYGARMGLQYSPDYGRTWIQSELVDKIGLKVAKNQVNGLFYAIAQEKLNTQKLNLYKLNLSNIIEIKDYRYSVPKEMIFTSYIP